MIAMLTNLITGIGNFGGIYVGYVNLVLYSSHVWVFRHFTEL